MDKIASLSNDIAKIERDQVELVAEYLETRVNAIVKDFYTANGYRKG